CPVFVFLNNETCEKGEQKDIHILHHRTPAQKTRKQKLRITRISAKCIEGAHGGTKRKRFSCLC
ncbi:MAG: hypothetical protein, partial [Olavius algarvensis Gamma 1 endosymbiont]